MFSRFKFGKTDYFTILKKRSLKTIETAFDLGLGNLDYSSVGDSRLNPKLTNLSRFKFVKKPVLITLLCYLRFLGFSAETPAHIG